MNKSMSDAASDRTNQAAEYGKSAEFEETLTRLAEHARGRVKYDEFTSVDRTNLLDLFVNNERTLLKIYELLFSAPVSNFKQTQILANASDSIQLSDVSVKNLKLIESSMIT